MVDWAGKWFIQFDTPCEWLVEGRCTHYELRPEICRDYDPAECERYLQTPAEKFYIGNEKDLARYLAERKARAASRRSARGRAGRGS
jgi:Fe-S-cluster containining protein